MASRDLSEYFAGWYIVKFDTSQHSHFKQAEIRKWCLENIGLEGKDWYVTYNHGSVFGVRYEHHLLPFLLMFDGRLKEKK